MSKDTKSKNEVIEQHETEKKKRAPHAYNIFMKKEVAAIKKVNPGIKHTLAFSQAAAKWKESPENPKNK